MPKCDYNPCNRDADWQILEGVNFERSYLSCFWHLKPCCEGLSADYRQILGINDWNKGEVITFGQTETT